MRKQGGYIIYIYSRDGRGDLRLANYVKTGGLDPGRVRSDLKEARIYLGTCFSEAVYNPLETLELMEKVLE